ncbi:MAG: hypothetical protein QM617_13260 [Comamonas sp.]
MTEQLRRYTRDDAQITVTVRGREYQGWLESEVERSLESVAGAFSIPVSLVPGQPPDIERQDEITVRINGVPVIVGYVLAAAPFYRAGDCGMRITGRDRTGDLVHSTAIYKGGQWINARIDRICRDLLTPFGIKLTVDTDIGAAVPDFKLGHGETVVEAISRAARLRGVLAIRGDDGHLVLTKAGTTRFDGAIARGHNVIEMDDLGSDEQRHSEYIVFGQRNVADDDAGDVDVARAIKSSAKDAEIKRYLPLVIHADGNTTPAELSALAAHTARVRRGHAYGIRYLVEGWTCKGKPWPLNQRVPIYDDVAGLDGAEWLIASVKQTCSLKDGDVTELIVRPIEAYDSAPLQTRKRRKRWDGTRGPSDKANDKARAAR